MPSDAASAVADVSIVICTHNPRPDYFARVLQGLRNQAFPLHRAELLVVDNASPVPLSMNWDLDWYPAARHISEAKLGLYWARRRGILEASAELIIFVDDDNVLEETYIAEAVAIHQKWPMLGAWGSASISGDFEVELPERLMELRPWLALRQLDAPRWSNVVSGDDVIPWGAGLCVRRDVALAYVRANDQSPIQITGRQGSALFSADDREIALVSCHCGFGIGIFPELKLLHLIPRQRVSEAYFIRLAEGAFFSNFILDYKWHHITPQSPFGFRTLLTLAKTVILYRGLDRKKRLAWVRALAKAKRFIENQLREPLVTSPPTEQQLVQRP